MPVKWLAVCTDIETTGEQGEGKETEEGVEKRALPAMALTLLKNPKVQEAVIEKGIEVAGKLVDKQLKIIDEAQEKAEQFLKKEVTYVFICLFQNSKSWCMSSVKLISLIRAPLSLSYSALLR